MADADNAAGEFSLANLMDLDISDIEEIRFEQVAQGIYDFIVKNPELSEGTNKDDERIFYFSAKLEVEEVVSVLDQGVDPESVVGKVHNHRQNIEPADAAMGIGRIRAFATDIGIDSSGTLGEVVERMKDHRFRAKIVHQADKTDPSIKYARLRFENAKK